ASQDVKKQGMVPFLGVFLDDLLADQLPEHDEEVTNILYQIMMHKRVARLYDLEPDERFQSFFQTVELLDEEQRFLKVVTSVAAPAAAAAAAAGNTCKAKRRPWVASTAHSSAPEASVDRVGQWV
ncbi:Ral guanine nucleotide dissociation stimulator, partial [Manis javanica]